MLTGRQHVLGERVDHQRPARRGRRGDPDWVARPAASRTASIRGQLRHDVLLDPVPRRECQGFRRLHGWLRARPMLRALRARASPAARWRMISRTRSATRPKGGWLRALRVSHRQRLHRPGHRCRESAGRGYQAMRDFVAPKSPWRRRLRTPRNVCQGPSRPATEGILLSKR